MQVENERELLRKVHAYLSNPSQVFMTQSNNRLQILSPGKMNLYDGPDLKNIAILLNGYVIVGDAEFHRSSSDWLRHAHSTNIEYDDVVIHIVFKDDTPIKRDFETLVIDETQLKLLAPTEKRMEIDIANDIEELQNYALIRLLRMTAKAKKMFNNGNLREGFHSNLADFLQRYASKRRRPSYDEKRLNEILENLTNSEMIDFLNFLEIKETVSIPDTMHGFIKKRIANEGAHLRREIVLNCLLPSALSIADDNSRISLFSWFWSTSALNTYGVLKKRFPNIPQNFLWQQQGMLEYIKENGRQPDYISETANTYGFGEILSFYKLGRLPLEFFED